MNEIDALKNVVAAGVQCTCEDCVNELLEKYDRIVDLLEQQRDSLKCCGNCKWLCAEKDKDEWVMRKYCGRPTGGGGFEIDDRSVELTDTCSHWEYDK